MLKLCSLFTLVLLFSGLFAGRNADAVESFNVCFCYGISGQKTCGGGAPIADAGKRVNVSDGDINNYIRDMTLFYEFWSKKDITDPKTGWRCKRY